MTQPRSTLVSLDKNAGTPTLLEPGTPGHPHCSNARRRERWDTHIGERWDTHIA